jgi:hypothetical protein
MRLRRKIGPYHGQKRSVTCGKMSQATNKGFSHRPLLVTNDKVDVRYLWRFAD